MRELAFALIFYAAFGFGLGLTRLVYLRSYGTSYFALASVTLALTVAAVAIPEPYGFLLAILLAVYSAWFAWSPRVPMFFKQLSYERLVGSKDYRAEDVPDTVWARPRFIASWWPSWL